MIVMRAAVGRLDSRRSFALCELRVDWLLQRLKEETDKPPTAVPPEVKNQQQQEGERLGAEEAEEKRGEAEAEAEVLLAQEALLTAVSTCKSVQNTRHRV